MHVSHAFRPALIAIVLAAVASMIGATPAYAITGGQPDKNWHPQVGLVYYEVEYPDEPEPVGYICSGTLISETVVLTAGHCTYGLSDLGVTEMLVTFEDTVTSTTLFYTSVEWAAHPDYEEDRWPYTYDVGLIVLSEPVKTKEGDPWPIGKLPSENQLAGIIPARGASKQVFTDVGYGQAGVETGGGPPIAAFPMERRMSRQQYHPGQNSLVGSMHGMDDLMLQLKSSPSARHGSGCGGDSGGPIFLDDSATVVAIHTGGYSLGVNASICGRISSVNHRIDTPVVLNWLNDEISLRAGE